LWRKPENSIGIGAPSLALLEDSDDRIHAFGKSRKKNLRSMPSHDPLLSDRTEDKDADADMEEDENADADMEEDEDADVDMEEAAVVEDLPQKNANTVSTTNSVSIVANPDTSLSIVPNCPITGLVPVFDHKAADLLSDKSIPPQKKGWRNCHSKIKVELISLPLINLSHWSNSI